MATELEIQPSGPVRGTIRPPGSKSLTNRALVCAALAQGRSTLDGALDSDDTRAMIGGLRQLGIHIGTDASRSTVDVSGCHGTIPASTADIFAGNSGTTMRFLTAVCALGQGTYRLDGVPRMRQRPIGDLLAALRDLGVETRCLLRDGCPPVIVHSQGLAGGVARVSGGVSSQFLSGLLLAAPCAKGDVYLRVEGQLVSEPYVDMTLHVMRRFGAQVERRNNELWVSSCHAYLPRQFEIEPDASAASYFWSAAALTGGAVTVEGLGKNAIQGDVAFCDCLEQMGCRVTYESNRITVRGGPLQGIDCDMRAISDTVLTLAVLAACAHGPTRIRGVGHIRQKETDRIRDLATELRKLNAAVEEHHDGLTITPGRPGPATIDTYNDHRMAMSFAVAGLALPGIVIRNPQCTTKTYPSFFSDLEKLARGS
jgi:3-phosphoshikimate 1-carboxyvinyltransferase